MQKFAPVERAPWADVVRRLEENITLALKGKPDAVRLALTALLARGHILIEDVPGVGKTTLAQAAARSIGCSFQRIQFTSDLLPSDVLGVSVWNPKDAVFEFKRGPIFANVILADEINRTTPKTQSCLLEAMSDGQVTIEDVTHHLEPPFIVIATQNPVEHYGTYPLPESQMDRFLMRITIGYPDDGVERQILQERKGQTPIDAVSQVVSAGDVLAMQAAVDEVTVDPSIDDYIIQIVRETRESPLLELGVSTRGALGLHHAAKARAFLDGRTFALPDDARELAISTFAHRVVVSRAHDSVGRMREEADRIIREILERIPIPS